jgi:hypothetical protein
MPLIGAGVGLLWRSPTMRTNHCPQVQEELYAELQEELPEERPEEQPEALVEEEDDDDDAWTYLSESAR